MALPRLNCDSTPKAVIHTGNNTSSMTSAPSRTSSEAAPSKTTSTTRSTQLQRSSTRRWFKIPPWANPPKYFPRIGRILRNTLYSFCSPTWQSLLRNDGWTAPPSAVARGATSSYINDIRRRQTWLAHGHSLARQADVAHKHLFHAVSSEAVKEQKNSKPSLPEICRGMTTRRLFRAVPCA